MRMFERSHQSDVWVHGMRQVAIPRKKSRVPKFAACSKDTAFVRPPLIFASHSCASVSAKEDHGKSETVTPAEYRTEWKVRDENVRAKPSVGCVGAWYASSRHP